MKKKLTVKRGYIPKPLTDYEEKMLGSSIYLPGWQLNSTILPKCILIQEPIISGYYSEPIEGEPSTYESVCIYGLIGISQINSRIEGEKIVSNFFVIKGTELYQCRNIENALDLVELLRKKYRREQYRRGKLEEKEKQTQKQIKAA